jgi:hypothetical protein
MLKLNSIFIRNYFLLMFVCFTLQFIPQSSNAQNTFEIRFNSCLDEYPRDFIMDSNNDFVCIIWKAPTTDYIPESYIYKISPEGDTAGKLFTKQDTVLKLYKIIQAGNSPLEYLVTGIGYNRDSSASLWFSYFMKITENMDIIWQKTYQLHNVDEYACIPILPQLLKEKENTFLHACFLTPHWKMYLFRISSAGDSLVYRIYENDSSGEISDLTYNYDSSAYWLHTHFAHYSSSGPESQCITVNFDLEQTNVMYYPRWFAEGISAKLLPDRNLVAGSIFWEPLIGGYNFYLAAFKLDTAFNVLAECKFTHPDTTTQGGSTTMDFYYPSCIYVGGDHTMPLGIWEPVPTWIVIAKMNVNLEIEFEKYIGGDAHYDFKTVTAASDSGILISGTRYDWNTQNYERDAIIIKLDMNGCITDIQNQNKIKVSTAIVYPNPGSEEINIRTALKNTIFEMYDMNGKLIISKNLKQNITKINSILLNPGTYTWNVYDKTKVYDTGKWIKTK